MKVITGTTEVYKLQGLTPQVYFVKLAVTVKSKTSDWLPGGRGAFEKVGTYHWDLYNPKAGVGDHAIIGSHLQIHNFDGSIFRIFFQL